jgi:hypothetical protein
MMIQTFHLQVSQAEQRQGHYMRIALADCPRKQATQALCHLLQGKL